ncbi:MBL fold metallo-hydrolase [Sphingomonas bacterium]|uniref:MBL fold metallo-hydrolase n=1 Tax=Sphingomonas bacterium TaxID=1895847 RepID=UPI00157663C1|nr:MBL fold metallo-hydrolase [Sphingomonas bacterium]
MPPDELKLFLVANGQDPDVLMNPISCLCVTLADGRRMIVDSGIGGVAGPDGSPIPSAGRFADAVRRAGIDPATIDTVFVSHIHPDHIGGLFDDDDQPLFPNADIHVTRQEV